MVLKKIILFLLFYSITHIPNFQETHAQVLSGSLTAEEIIKKAVIANSAPSEELIAFQCSTKTSVIFTFDFSIQEDLSLRIIDNQTNGVIYWKKPNYFKYVMLRDVRIYKDEDTPLENTKQSYHNFFNLMRRNAAGTVNFDYFKAVSPLCDSCLTYYNYYIISIVTVDIWKKAYEIGFRPKNNNLPGLIGKFIVEDKDFTLLEADFTTNDKYKHQEFIIKFDAIGYRFKFMRYAETYTLTEKIELYEKLHVALFGKGDVFYQAEYSDYEINPELDDSLFVGPDLDMSNAEYILRPDLSPIDQLLAVQIEKSRSKYEIPVDKYFIINGRFSDFFRYNRVQGTYLGAGIVSGYKLSSRLKIGLFAGYSFADERLNSRIFLSTKNLLDDKLIFRISAYDKLFANNEWVTPMGLNSFSSLFLKKDHLDFLYTTGWNLMGKYWPDQRFGMRFRYFSEKHTHAYTNTNYSFFRQSKSFRDVRQIATGYFSGMSLQFHYNTRYGYTEKAVGLSIFAEFTKADKMLGRNTANFNRFFIDITQFKKLGKGFSYEINQRYGFGSAGIPPQYQFSNTRMADVGIFKDTKYNYGNRMLFTEIAVFYRHPLLDYLPFFNNYKIQLIAFSNVQNIYNAFSNSNPFSFPHENRVDKMGIGIDDANGFFRIALTETSIAFRIRKIIPFTRYPEK